MLNAFIFYLKLAILCLQLIFSLAIFGLNFVFTKLDQKKLFSTILVLLIVFIWLINFYLLQQRTTAQIILKEIHFKDNARQADLETREFLLDEAELNDKTLNQEKLAQEEIKNLKLFLNLSKLHEELNNQELAKKYLDQAALIEPKINLAN